jgi:aminoglycoside 6'-N-acetyltransferase I
MPQKRPRIIALKRSQIPEWQRLRVGLWPDVPLEEHRKDMVDILSDLEFNAVFVAVGAERRLHGFVEVSMRLTAEGCNSSPIGYLEGWYVEPDQRGKGIGRALVKKAEAWALANGCKEMASDVEAANGLGRTAHESLGYEEVEVLAHYRRSLKDRPA